MDSSSSSSDHNMSIDEQHHHSSFFVNNDHIHFIREVNRSKFPIYLVYDTKTNQHKALKLFPWNSQQTQPSSFFLKEIKFSKIRHPNIISISNFQVEQYVTSSRPSKVSYTLMDYARHGDLFDALKTKEIPFSDALSRSYFQQIVAGVEALHSYGAAHLDLKLENILLDNDFQAKIADFDMSFVSGDRKVVSRGTSNYRPPEIIRGNCQDPQAADVYSLGIIMFLLKTNGILPFAEGVLCCGVNMKELLENNTELFWKKHYEFTGIDELLSDEDFKTLFLGMTHKDPAKRMTIKEVKASKWWNKEIVPKEKIFSYMSEKFYPFSS